MVVTEGEDEVEGQPPKWCYRSVPTREGSRLIVDSGVRRMKVGHYREHMVAVGDVESQLHKGVQSAAR